MPHSISRVVAGLILRALSAILYLSSMSKSFSRSRLVSLLVQLLTGLSVFVTLGLAAATLVSLTVPRWWLGDLLSHLRFHYALGLLVCTLCLIVRHRWVSLLVFLLTLVNLSILVPFYAARPPIIPTASTLCILHYNLDMTASSHQAAFAYLRQQQADVLFLQEVTPALAAQFARELPAYRVVYAQPLPNTHGSALLLPINTTLMVQSVGTVHLPTTSPRPMITATIAYEGRPLALLSLQVVRPKDAYTEDIQATEYDAVAAWVSIQRQRTGTPMLVIGDCNTTPWSARFQQFLVASGLQDTSIGFGFQPTWSASLPVLLGLPIDHAFVSPELVTQARVVGPDLGGDHAPLWVTIALPEVKLPAKPHLLPSLRQLTNRWALPLYEETLENPIQASGVLSVGVLP